MSRPVNLKCLECALNVTQKQMKVKPKECYKWRVCSRRRSYYRDLEGNRAKQRAHHRYRKHMTSKCLVCASTQQLEAHHILPQSIGGLDVAENIVTLCKHCHNIVTVYNRRIGAERQLLA